MGFYWSYTLLLKPLVLMHSWYLCMSPTLNTTLSKQHLRECHGNMQQNISAVTILGNNKHFRMGQISILPFTPTPSHTLPHLTTLTIVWWAQEGTCSYGQLVRYPLCIVAVATVGAQCRHPGHLLQSPVHRSTGTNRTRCSLLDDIIFPCQC